MLESIRLTKGKLIRTRYGQDKDQIAQVTIPLRGGVLQVRTYRAASGTWGATKGIPVRDVLGPVLPDDPRLKGAREALQAEKKAKKAAEGKAGAPAKKKASKQ